MEVIPLMVLAVLAMGTLFAVTGRTVLVVLFTGYIT